MKNSTQSPLATVVIPVKNGGTTLRRCLEGIYSQTMADQTEVLIIDSGSTDNTLEIAAEFPVRVIQIAPSAFNHGATRNLGVRNALGEFIVMTVQDAWPSEKTWLEKMLRHFDDPDVAGVCGQQIVDHDPAKNPLQWFRPSGGAMILRHHFPEPEKFNHLPGKDKYRFCHWDDVNAAYRKSDLLQIPFRELSFGEDMMWAKDALSKGKAIIYDYSARVYHYHDQTFRFYFKRTYLSSYHIFQGFKSVPFGEWLPLKMARIVYRISRIGLRPDERYRWMLYNLRITLAGAGSKYIFLILHSLLGMKGVQSGLKVFCGIIPQGRPVQLSRQIV